MNLFNQSNWSNQCLHSRREGLISRKIKWELQIKLFEVWYGKFLFCLTGYTSGVNNTGDLKTLHADMGLIAWGALLPFGAIIPRYFKHHDPQWFDRHISIQIVGFLLGLATVVAGRALYNGLESDGIPKFNIHRPLGSLVFCLSILQVCFRLGRGLYLTSTKYISSGMLKTKFSSCQVLELILRPDKTSKWRKDWKHHWVGRLALFLGALKIVIGLLVQEAGSGWKIGYGFLITFILVTVTVLDVSLGLGRSNKADAIPVFGCN